MLYLFEVRGSKATTPLVSLMSGYHLLVGAMVLQPVEILSDDEQAGKNQSNKKEAEGKAKAAPKKVLPMKKTPDPKGKPEPKPKAKLQPTPKTKPGPAPKAQSAKPGPKTASKKRPASASAAGAKKGKVSISKGLYKNGMYGFKVNGKELLKVP